MILYKSSEFAGYEIEFFHVFSGRLLACSSQILLGSACGCNSVLRGLLTSSEPPQTHIRSASPSQGFRLARRRLTGILNTDERFAILDLD